MIGEIVADHPGRVVLRSRIGGQRMPEGLIRGFGLLKQAAAEANMTMGKLDKKIGKAIAAAAAGHEQAVGGDYDALSALFSSIEQVTIERYVILQRIEFVKELLKYGELSMSEIAWELGYSSSQHMSSQFHTVTGMNGSP